MRYEMIREIFNACSGSQMDNVSVSEVECDDTDKMAKSFINGKATIDKSVDADGTIIYDIFSESLHQRISFTED